MLCYFCKDAKKTSYGSYSLLRNLTAEDWKVGVKKNPKMCRSVYIHIHIQLFYANLKFCNIINPCSEFIFESQTCFKILRTFKNILVLFKVY
jgi:hypothetical protein